LSSDEAIDVGRVATILTRGDEQVVVVAPKPPRSRKPLPKREPPACGPVVRMIRGKAVERQAQLPEFRFEHRF
jgi:hypothetical protein